MYKLHRLATVALIPLVRHLNKDYFVVCKVRDLPKLMERSCFIMPTWLVKSSEEFVNSLYKITSKILVLLMISREFQEPNLQFTCDSRFPKECKSG